MERDHPVQDRVHHPLLVRRGRRLHSQAGCGTCVICDVFGHQGQRGKLAFRDSYLEDPAGDLARTHVAIDRVTGGARDALLFQTTPIPAGGVHLRIDQLAPASPWVSNAILHVLRDIDDGLIGVGSKTTTGLGALRLTSPPDLLAALEAVVVDDLEPRPDEEPAT